MLAGLRGPVLFALNCVLVTAMMRPRVALAFSHSPLLRVGRNGPQVYNSWPECNAAVKGVSRAVFKSFNTYEEARSFAFGSDAARAFHSSSTARAAGKRTPPRMIAIANGVDDSEKKVEVDFSERSTTTVVVGKRPPQPGSEKRCVVYFDGGSRGNPGHAG